ncbi:hypothetical protein GCM10025868_46260 [Angustibacter aerolatus]|uniref:N-acetyltransferase domain-containing protein n=1 Tax=Angustibacter aerolatus TaxID=1162965 RepID=A0ABQ6JRR0_9ACTN|nr:GNAT family N-acetyltransferase [Angustibacter aerolatus]GMA89376.1 hypothetical protein GCM10025868_46260 [Angustibacter aerolatus]
MTLLDRLDEVHGLLHEAVLGGAALGWLEPPSRDEVAALLADLDARLATGDAGVRVVEDGGALVALGFWRRRSRPSLAGSAEPGRLVVADAHRGRGLGGRLVDALLADAAATGVEVLTLDVRADNARAVALYERHGFVVGGRVPGIVRWGDQRFDLLTMFVRPGLSAALPDATAEHLCGWVVLRRPDDGRVLLARRSGVLYGEGLWGLPGGHVSRGERYVVGAVREPGRGGRRAGRRGGRAAAGRAALRGGAGVRRRLLLRRRALAR